MADTLLNATDVTTHFTSGSILDRRPLVQAVNGASLALDRGERLGLVGESGSGKTTLVRSLLGLTSATSGDITVAGVDVRRLTTRNKRRLRRHAQMIYQDPQGSLSPRLKVGRLLTEPYRIHRIPADERSPVAELLEMVGLNPEQADKYPHELSGGQARRVGIARALALKPQLLIADEPTSGLDVSAAGDIVNLLKAVSTDLKIGYIVVTHNLNIVAHAAERLAVMYLGQVVEEGPTRQVLNQPAHPYTRALLHAIPEPDPAQRRNEDPLPGEVPSARTPPPGCRFHTRCPIAAERCRTEPPKLLPVIGDDRQAACHFSAQLLEQAT